MDYQKDIIIDPDSLDLEWLDQASLFMKYARGAAIARADLDQAKENLDVVRAGLDKEIRTNPEKFKIDKITETVVTNTIIGLIEFQKANEKFLTCKFEVDISQAAVNAMNQRKDALENLVKLNGQSYFAGPKVPRDLSFEVQKKHNQAEVNKGVKQGLTRGGK